MSENAATAGPSTAEAVEELLRQLVDARFVLTDRDGAVTRWSRPAEELFGWPGARMLGRPLAETLELGIELPETGGRLSATARRKDGNELELALTFVPVRMSQSLEFNGFLEALEIAAPRGNALGQLQRSHKTVVDWISAAIAGQAEIEEEGLAAGTIVAFRPLQEPPPPDPDPSDETVAAPVRRPDDVERLLEGTHAELAAARAEAEALRGEATRTSARLQQLEEAGAGFGSELGDTRRVLEEMAAQVEGLRGELERTRTAGEEQAREERERLRRDAEDGQSERERLRRQLDELQGTVEELRRDLAGAPAEQERLRAQMEQTREQVGALEGAVPDGQGLAGWVEAVHERMATLESALAEAGTGGREAAEEAAGALREELTETRARIDAIESERAGEREGLEGRLAGAAERLEALERARGEERERLEALERARGGARAAGALERAWRSASGWKRSRRRSGRARTPRSDRRRARRRTRPARGNRAQPRRGARTARSDRARLA